MDRLPSELYVEILQHCTQISTDTLLTASQLSRTIRQTYKANEKRLLSETALATIPPIYLDVALVIGNPDPSFELDKSPMFPNPYDDATRLFKEAPFEARIARLRQDFRLEALPNALKVHNALVQLAHACSHEISMQDRWASFRFDGAHEPPEWFCAVYRWALNTTYAKTWPRWHNVLSMSETYPVSKENSHGDAEALLEREDLLCAFLESRLEDCLLYGGKDVEQLTKSIRESVQESVQERTESGIWERVMESVQKSTESVASNEIDGEDGPEAAWQEMVLRTALRIIGDEKRAAKIIAKAILRWSHDSGDRKQVEECQMRWRWIHGILRATSREERVKAVLAWTEKEQEYVERYCLETVLSWNIQ